MSRIPQIARPARLTSSLLVRKGEARPASAAAGQGPSTLLPSDGIAVQLQQEAAADPRSRGRAALRLTAVPETNKAEDAAPHLSPSRRASQAGGSGGGSEARFATTIRLDAVRHYRLRLFAARHRLEVPELITKALDAYLEANGSDCPCLRDVADCSC